MEIGEVKAYPLRSLDDFLTGSARFQLPNYKDLDKWGKRVVYNLLYYQTNYFLIGTVMFLLISWSHLIIMLFGVITIITLVGFFHFIFTFHSFGTRFNKKRFSFGIIFSIISCCILLYFMNKLVLFLFAILLPISTIFVHASLRLRNIKNKLSVNIERTMNYSTPMGIFLELFFGPDIYS